MSKKINLEISTPERVIFSSEVNQMTLPTHQGEITILPSHIPLVTSLTAGELKIIRGKEEILMAVSGGLMQVDPDRVRILADTAELSFEIDEQRAEEARVRAFKLMQDKSKEEVDYTVLAAKIEKELARLKVARHRKQKGQQPPLN